MSRAKSSTKIEKLTAEQEAMLPVYRDRWLKIGFSCEPCDVEKARAAVDVCYRSAGLEPPGLVIVMDSPVSGAVAAAMLQAGAQVWDQVWDQVGARVGDQVRDQVGGRVGAQVLAQVRDQVRDQVWDRVGDQVLAQVGAQVGAQVYGSHDAGWLSWLAFFHEVVGLDCTEPARGLIELAHHCGWWAPYKNVAILQHRHCELHRDAQDRLHNDRSAAVLYRDGFGVWAWHGVRVPREVIEQPESITVQGIETEQNTEVRRVMIERYGAARYLLDSGAEKVNEDDYGVLYRKPRKDDTDLVMVKVVNSTPEADGSFKDYFIRVNSELRPMLEDGSLGQPQVMTARNAVASTFGKRGEEYCPCMET